MAVLPELKRRLDNNETTLSKRLRLAENVVSSTDFPLHLKEEIVLEWFFDLIAKGVAPTPEFHAILASFCECIQSVDNFDRFSLKTKNTLIEKLINILEMHSNHTEQIIKCVIDVCDNQSMMHFFNQYPENYVRLIRAYMHQLNSSVSDPQNTDARTKNALDSGARNLIKFYKSYNRKLQFVVMATELDLFSVLFATLDRDCSFKTLIDLFQMLLFPQSRRNLYSSYLTSLIRGTNLDVLKQEKGDQLDVVIAVITDVLNKKADLDYISNFSAVFINLYKSEPQLVMIYCVVIFSFTGVKQTIITVSDNALGRVNVNYDRNLLVLKVVQNLKLYNIDMNTKFTNVLLEESVLVEIRRSFISFLQNICLESLNAECDFGSSNFDLMVALLELEPSILEPKIEAFLPMIMTRKKDECVLKSYENLLSTIIETVFKMSRGIEFVHKLLPHVKTILETINDEQYELKVKEKELVRKGKCPTKAGRKILNGEDLFPLSCHRVYGKLYADLLMRQQVELFEMLTTDINEYCVSLLIDGFISPSIITFLEVLSSLLIHTMDNCKLADYGIPTAISERFWNSFKDFGDNALAKIGESILRLSHDGKILKSFLGLCLSYGNLKLLNIRYSAFRPWARCKIGKKESAVHDLTLVHSYFEADQWNQVSKRIEDENETECNVIMKRLVLQKIMACRLLPLDGTMKIRAKNQENILKNHLLSGAEDPFQICTTDYHLSAILTDLESTTIDIAAESIVNMILNSEHEHTFDILNKELVLNNRRLLEGLLMQGLKSLWKIFKLSCQTEIKIDEKLFDSNDFKFVDFYPDSNDAVSYFETLSNGTINKTDKRTVMKLLRIIKSLQVPYLSVNFQLATLFAVVLLKSLSSGEKKILSEINFIIINIFELSVRLPELFNIFPMEYMMRFGEKSFCEIASLGMDDKCQIVEFILKSAIKAIKFNPDPIRSAVKCLIASAKNANNFGHGLNPFEVICILVTLVCKEKRQAGNSEQRSVLSECEDKLHKSLVKHCKQLKNDGVSVNLNVLEAFSIVLSKYGERKVDEHREAFENMTSNLEHFLPLAIKCIEQPVSPQRHVASSFHLILSVFKNKHNLAAHSIFEKFSTITTDVWIAVKSRLNVIFDDAGCRETVATSRSDDILEQIGAVLKYIFEQCEVGTFNAHIMKDILDLSLLKKPSTIAESETPLRNITVAKFLWSNLIKCILRTGKSQTFSKALARFCRDLDSWNRAYVLIEQIYEINDKHTDLDIVEEKGYNRKRSVAVANIDSKIVKVVRTCLEIIIEFVSMRKMELQSLTLDSILRIPQSLERLLSPKSDCLIAPANVFCVVHELLTDLLSALLLNRSELLEDRWPCFLQIYRMLVHSLCLRCTSSETLEDHEVRGLSKLALNLEKTTSTMARRKFQLSRLSAYLIGDLASYLERAPPPVSVRQHLENCALALMQSSDNNYTMSFLNRALAGSHGQVALNNLYSAYKKYHKYTGTS